MLSYRAITGRVLPGLSDLRGNTRWDEEQGTGVTVWTGLPGG